MFTSRFVGAWESVSISRSESNAKTSLPTEAEEEFGRFLSFVNAIHQGFEGDDTEWNQINFDTFPILYNKFPEMDTYKRYISVGEIVREIEDRPFRRFLSAVTGRDNLTIESTEDAKLDELHHNSSSCMVFAKGVPPTLNAEDLIRCMSHIGPVKGVQIFRNTIVDSMYVNKKKERMISERFSQAMRKQADREKTLHYENLSGQYHGTCLELLGLTDHPGLWEKVQEWVSDKVDPDAVLEAEHGAVVLSSTEILDETILLQTMSQKLKLDPDHFDVQVDKIVIEDYAHIWRSSRKRVELARLGARLKTINSWLKQTGDRDSKIASAHWTYHDIVEGERFAREKDLVITGMCFLGGVQKVITNMVAKQPDIHVQKRSSHFVGKAQNLGKFRQKLKPYKTKSFTPFESTAPPATKVNGSAIVWFKDPETVEKALDPHLRVTGIQIKGRTMRLTDCPKTLALNRIPRDIINKFTNATRMFELYDVDVDEQFCREDVHIPYPLRQQAVAPLVELPASLRETYDGLEKVYISWPLFPNKSKTIDDLTQEFVVGGLDEPDTRIFATYLAYYLATSYKSDNIAPINVSTKNMMVFVPNLHSDEALEFDPNWRPQLFEKTKNGSWLPLVTISTEESEHDLIQSTSVMYSRDHSALTTSRTNTCDFINHEMIYGAVAIHTFKPIEVKLQLNSTNPQGTKIWVNGELYNDSVILQAGFNQFLFEFTDGTIPSMSLNNEVTGFNQWGMKWRYDIPTPSLILEYESPEKARTSLNALLMCIQEDPKLWKKVRAEFFEKKDPFDMKLQCCFSAPKYGEVGEEEPEFHEEEDDDIFATSETKSAEVDVGDIFADGPSEAVQVADGTSGDTDDDWGFLFSSSEPDNFWTNFEKKVALEEHDMPANVLEELLALMAKTHNQEESAEGFGSRRAESQEFVKLLGKRRIVRTSSMIATGHSSFDPHQNKTAQRV